MAVAHRSPPIATCKQNVRASCVRNAHVKARVRPLCVSATRQRPMSQSHTYEGARTPYMGWGGGTDRGTNVWPAVKEFHRSSSTARAPWCMSGPGCARRVVGRRIAELGSNAEEFGFLYLRPAMVSHKPLRCTSPGRHTLQGQRSERRNEREKRRR
eukprot:1116628-Rhodomonas_salina.1